MSSSDSSSIAEMVAVSQGVRMGYTIGMSIATLLVYDALLCIDKEVRYVWQAPKASRKLSRFLYVYNRYMSILWNLLELGIIGTISDTSCTVLNWLNTTLEYLTLLGPASFTTLRVYALSGRNKMLTGAVLLLSMGPFLVNTATLYQLVPVNLPLPYGCEGEFFVSTTAYIAMVIVSRSCLILADTAAVLVTWWRTRTTRQASTQILRRSSLEQILWENGNVYFCTLLALNIADMVVQAVVLSATADSESINSADYVMAFIDPISSILNSRFLLALYETNAYLERGGTSASSFSTLNFGEADPRAEGSPELPDFLNSLAGPIHSFPDNDPELFDSEPTAAQLAFEMEVSDGETGEATELTEMVEVGGQV